MSQCINALRKWTGKKNVLVLYDSMADECSTYTFFDSIKGKEQIAVIGFTPEGDVLGYYCKACLLRQDTTIFDPDLFLFSFESRGRCKTPKRFLPKRGVKNDLGLGFSIHWASDSFANVFVARCGSISFGNERLKDGCSGLSKAFKDMEDLTLTGNQYPCYSRLIAVRLF